MVTENKSVENTSKLITLFRYCAIVMVVLCHYAQMFDLPKIASNIMSFGQMGCQIFFIMSAFGCFMSIEKNNYSYISFMKHRLKKIIPSWVGGVILYQIMMRLGIVDVQTNFILVLANTFLLHGFIPNLKIMNGVILGGWYIGTLVVFYLLTYPLFRFNLFLSEKVRNKYDGLILPTVSLLVTVLLYAPISFYDLIENNNGWYFFFINQFSSFVFGIALYDNYNKETVKYPLVKAMVAICFFAFLWQIGNGIVWTLIPYFFCMSIYYLFFAFKDVNIKSKCVWELITKISENSMAIYITHPLLVYSSLVVLLQQIVKDSLCYINKLFDVCWQISELELMLILMPLILWGCYLISFIFKKMIDIVNNCCFDCKKIFKHFSQLFTL